MSMYADMPKCGGARECARRRGQMGMRVQHPFNPPPSVIAARERNAETARLAAERQAIFRRARPATRRWK